MTTTLFQFGEQRPEFPVRVLDERAVRAGAGLLFVLAMVAFMNAWLMGNFQPTRLFVLIFVFDFFVRLFINPRYAPSLVLGRWFVRRQTPEWVGAPQKRFAWALGLALAVVMLVLVVILDIKGPVNLLVCATCLVLMFSESAFGICIGCKLYNAFNKEQAQLCPGGVCALPEEYVKGLTMSGYLSLLALLGWAFAANTWVSHTGTSASRQSSPEAAKGPIPAAEIERCKVPEFAKIMGHEEKWKLHNNCQ